MTEDDLPEILLPADWPNHVVRVILHLIALAHYAFVRALGLAMQLPSDTVRMAVEIAQLRQTLLWRNEEIALLRSRLGRIAPRCRPHYRSCERLNILELQAAAGWSNARTARRFLVLPETISEWKRRDDGLVGPLVLVNKYPDLTRYAVQRLRTLCLQLGKQKIADVLCRAGIHLAMSTVPTGRRRRHVPDRTSPFAATRAILLLFASTIIAGGVICRSFPLHRLREFVTRTCVGCVRCTRAPCELVDSST